MKTKNMGVTIKNRSCFIFARCIILLLLVIMLCLTVGGCDLGVQVPGSEIESTVPEHGETDVATDTVISITFNKPALPQSFSGGPIPYFEYEKTWSADNTTIVLTPSENLLESTTYLITVGAVRFDDNSSLEQPVSFSFDTIVDESQSPAQLAMSPENVETVESIHENMDRLIMRGNDAETVCAEVVEMLEDDENIKAAGVDEENSAVWVDFNDGEIQIFQVEDNDEDGYGYIPDDAFLPERSENYSRKSWLSDNRAASEETGNTPHYLPANNKALLANSLEYLHPGIYINDSTDVINEMLSDRGYDVTRHALVLDDFKHLGDYGVIVLETHGTWRPAASFNANTLDSLSTQHVLLTTTRITDGNFPPDKNSITNDRTSLVSWTVKKSYLIVNGVTTQVSTIRNYGVTAEYVREQVNRFTDKTVFFLNGCRGLSSDVVPDETVSPFKDVFFEKCDKGALFMGWDGRTSFFTAVRAALNFFQYATASNRGLRVFGQDRSGSWAEVTLLKKLDVPWGGYNMTAQNSYDIIKGQNQVTCPKFKGTLQIESEGSDTYKNILMPHPLYVEFDAGGEHLIDMLTDTDPEVRVGGVKCTLVRDSENSNLWDIKIPSGAYGDLVVTENERKSISRTVYKWNPKIRIQGSYKDDYGQEQYTVNLSLHARATISAESLRENPFEDALPPAGFTTEFEREASVISWTISGSRGESVIYTSSGSGNHVFRDSDSGFMFYTYGTIGGFAMGGSITFPYKQTVTGEGISLTEDEEYSLTWASATTDVFDLLTSNWTVIEGLRSSTEESPYVNSVISQTDSWNEFSADPVFEAFVEPR